MNSYVGGRNFYVPVLDLVADLRLTAYGSCCAPPLASTLYRYVYMYSTTAVLEHDTVCYNGMLQRQWRETAEAQCYTARPPGCIEADPY